MKKLFFLISLAVIFGCEKESTGDSTTDSPSKPIVTTILESNGWKPSQAEKINGIYGEIKKDDYTLILGKRSNQAWFSKLDINGNEIYCCELPALEKWKFSHFNANSLLFYTKDIAFIRGWYSNIENPMTSFNNDAIDEQVLIIDYNKGNIIEMLDIMPSTTYNISLDYKILNSNNRHLLLRSDDSSQNGHLYMVNSTGKIQYDREYDTMIEGDYLRNGLIFIDDEVVCPILRFATVDPLSIFNLKSWTLIKKFDSKNGLVLKGDNYEQPQIIYMTDTTYLDKGNIVYVYGEYKRAADPISGVSSDQLLDKYIYKINSSTYDLDGPYKKN